MTICSSPAICSPTRGVIFRGAAALSTWSFDDAPDILHCTYQLPLRAKRACNIYTIHDLVPLRLPFTTLDNKRQTYRLLRKIAAEADHIVTVSENSKRDIVQLLGVPEERVTNTYEAVEFPRELTERSDDLVAEQLRGSYRPGVPGLPAVLRRAGAEEECRPADRRLHALGASTSRWSSPAPAGWGNQTEAKLLDELSAEAREPAKRQPAHLPFRICQHADAGDADPRAPAR